MSITIKSENIGELTKKFFEPGFISIPNVVGFFFPEEDEKKKDDAKKQNVSEFFFPEDDDKKDPHKGDKKKSAASYIKGIAGKFAIAAAVGTATFSSAASAQQTPQVVPPQAYLYIDGHRSSSVIPKSTIESCFQSIINSRERKLDEDDFLEWVEENEPMMTDQIYRGRYVPDMMCVEY